MEIRDLVDGIGLGLGEGGLLGWIYRSDRQVQGLLGRMGLTIAQIVLRMRMVECTSLFQVH
jgi:hypothetical protein